MNKPRNKDHKHKSKGSQKGAAGERSNHKRSDTRDKKPHGTTKPQRQAQEGAQPRGQGRGQGSAKRERANVRKIERLTLFGMHAVREAWLNPVRQIDGLYITPTLLEEFEQHIHAAKKAGLKRPEPVLVERSRLDASFPEGTVHQGIALRSTLLEESGATDIINAGEERIKTQGKRSLVLILDQVTDPHNIGAIIRSASAFGITGMIVQKKHTPPLQGIVGKTACGGLDHLLVAHETNLARTMEQLKDKGYYVIGLDERGEESLEDFTPPERCAFVLGAEGPGLRRLTKDGCDQMIKLPTGGAVGSLNVSNAAAICLYALSTHK